MTSRTRKGFTLIELLVVIAIIAVLIALLLPAVQQAREAARRSQCKNNFKQIALAMHNYHDTYNMLPAGYLMDTTNTVACYGWAVPILPYLDQGNLYQQLSPGNPRLRYRFTSTATDADKALLQTPLTVFRCPSDTTPALNNLYKFGNPNHFDVATSNYVAYCGPGAWGDFTFPSISGVGGPAGDYGGMFWGNSFVNFRDVTDGLTNTLMLSERDGGPAARNDSFRASTWVGIGRQSDISQIFFALASGNFRINHDYAALNQAQNQGKGVSSLHEGGVHVGLVDGSVRFLSENVNNATLYRQLVHRNDGGVVGEF